MGKVVPIDRDTPTVKSEWRIRDLKMQIAHNMALDDDLSGNQHKVASVLLFVLIDGETGWCYQKDEQLAQIANVSLGCLRKAIKSNPAFQKYFVVVPGTRKGRATEYQLTNSAMRDAARRREGDLKLLERANGESSLSPSSSLPEERSRLVVNFATSDVKGGNSCPDAEQELSPVGGKNCPPIPEETPMKNPHCDAGAAPQSIEIQTFLEKFAKLHPRLGSTEETERELRKALEGGADPYDILWGAEHYAIEQKGNQTRYISYSENWVREKRWESHPKPEHSTLDASKENVRLRYRRAIEKGNATLAKHCSVPEALKMISDGDVTAAQCRALGIDV